MIEKLVLRFDPVQDRLLMTIGLRGPGGCRTQRLWLTRRTCAVLIADLQAMKSLAVTEPQSAYRAQPLVSPPSSQTATASMAAEAAATDEARNDERESAAPELVTRIACARRRVDGRWVLRFHGPERQICCLRLSDQGLKGIDAALARQARGAGWRLGDPGEGAKRARTAALRSLH